MLLLMWTFVFQGTQIKPVWFKTLCLNQSEMNLFDSIKSKKTKNIFIKTKQPKPKTKQKS